MILEALVAERRGKKMGVKQAIRSIDAFPRAEEHLLQKTQSGALGMVSFSFYVFHSLTSFF